MPKTKFNGQIKNLIKDDSEKINIIQKNNFEEKENPNKLKVKLSPTLKYSLRKSIKKELTDSSKYSTLTIISKNLKKYNSTPEVKNVMAINNLIKCKSCHFLAKFKDYLIINYIEEFIRRVYSKKESLERIPKLYNYYKNYLKFFCRPIFLVPFANQIIKNYADFNADYFYKSNLEKKRLKIEKKILDNKINKDENNNYNNIIIEQSKPVGKTVFTKSIKNSIDNINIDDFSLSEKKIKKFSQNEGESIVKIFGNDEDETNLLLDNNSLLLMINEIKDVKEGKSSNKKPVIKEKNIKLKNDIDNSNAISKNIFKESSKNNNLKTVKNRNNKRNSNLQQSNTYINSLQFGSLKDIIYSPKSNKKGVFFVKKNNNNKNNRYLSPNTGKINSETTQKNTNSIIVNINININSNQEKINNKINTYNNMTNTNIENKSPHHQIPKIKKIFSFSPISSKDITNFKYDKPLLSSRNEESKKKNYIKIINKNNEYNNIIINTDRNLRNNEKQKTRNINKIDSLDFFKSHNLTSNKNNILYNREKSIKENIREENLIKDKNEKINKGLNSGKSNGINKNVYFSPNKFCKNVNLNNGRNNQKIKNNENKKFVYHKKSNYEIGSPLNKNGKFAKKFFHVKKE